MGYVYAFIENLFEQRKYFKTETKKRKELIRMYSDRVNVSGEINLN